MKDLKFTESVIEDAYKLLEDSKTTRQKQIDKMFAPIKPNDSLKDCLSSFNKSDLDEIRQNLKLSGVSSLKKADLIEVLSIKIDENLPYLLQKLTEVDYEFLSMIIENDGIIKQDDKFMDTFMYLRKYGILNGALLENEKYFVMSSDLLLNIKSLLNKSESEDKIKLNEKIYRLTKGILFYYGVVNFSLIQNKVSSFFNEAISALDLNELLCEFLKRDKNIVFVGDYWCHGKVTNYKEVISRIERESSIDYMAATQDMLLQAGGENFIDWNANDVCLYNYILNNFNLSEIEAENYINSIKLEFKNGEKFTNIFKKLSEIFNINDFKMAHEIGTFLERAYNTSAQWCLKGNCPNEITTTDESTILTLPLKPVLRPKIKIGRNEQCQCGSGKKYKNCCLR